jgi:hypothetical protein
LDFKEVDTIKKLLGWPYEYKLPVWDLLRAYLCHYQSESLFSGLDTGFAIISQLMGSLEMDNTEPFYGLVFRTLANVMVQNANKNGVIRYAETIFQTLEQFSKKGNLKNKGLLTAIAGFLFNFSATIYERNL